jgi:hypothetical protein
MLVGNGANDHFLPEAGEAPRLASARFCDLAH